MASIIEIDLPNEPPKHSGRGIRMRVLSPSERDKIFSDAIAIVGKDEGKFTLLRWGLGVKRALVEITAPGLTSAQIADPATPWIKVNAASLEESYEQLFTTADDEVLVALYREYHEPDPGAVKAILGKAKTKTV